MTGKIFFLTLLSSVSAAHAGSSALASYLKEVEEKNPAILSAQKNHEAAGKAVTAAWVPPDPSLELEKMYAGGPEERSFFIRQELPNPFKLSVRRKVSAAGAEYRKFYYLSVRNEVLEGAEAAFYSYYLAIMREKTYSEIAALLDSLSRAAAAANSSGKTGTADPLKAEIEYLKIKNLLSAAGREKEKAAARMSFFTGGTGTPATPEVDENIPRSDSYGDPEKFPGEKNPEILMERTAANKAALEAKEAGYSRYPDFMAGYRKRFYGPMDGTYDLVLGITLPIFFSANGARTAEAGALKEAAERASDYSALSKSYSWKETLYDFRLARDSALFYRDVILPQTELSLKNELRLYESGGGDLRNVMDAERAHLEARLTYYGYLELYYRSGAALKKLAGGSYEK